MKKITIPTKFGHPSVTVCINDIEYICLTGMEIEVEDCVAELFESMQSKIPKPAPAEPPHSGGGSGGKVLYMDAALLNAGGAYPVDADDYTTAVIPKEATFVSLEAFENLPYLDTLIVEGDCEFETYEIYDSAAKSYVPNNSIAMNRVPIRKLIVKNRTVNPPYFMLGVNTLVEIDFPGSVAIHSFKNCAYLRKITLENCPTIGEYAFSGCASLKEFTAPDSVESIESNAFYECDGLTTIAIPGSVKSIGYRAFCYCENLEKITLSEGVETIGSQAFYLCNKLTEVTLPASLKSIGGGTFYGCDHLETVTFLGMDTELKNDTPSATIPNATIVRGYAGSTVEAWADTYGYTFEVIEE